MPGAPRLTISAIVCAFNEAACLPGCVHALLAQTRPPDEIIVVDNASTDGTGDLARAIPGVRVVREPQRGLVRAREAARVASRGEVLAYVDADCRPPITWLAQVEQRFQAKPALVAVTGPYRFYDWDVVGRGLLRAYDLLVAPLTHWLVHHAFGVGAVLYGGNFAVRRDALSRINGFDRSIDFHGEDTNLGRRLTPLGQVDVAGECWVWTSARRYRALGKWTVFGLYVRNFWSEDPASSSGRPDPSGCEGVSVPKLEVRSQNLGERSMSVSVIAPEDAVLRIVVDYIEMPDLIVTARQAARLWNLPADICESALAALVSRGFLAQTRAGAFLRRSDGPMVLPKAS